MNWTEPTVSSALDDAAILLLRSVRIISAPVGESGSQLIGSINPSFGPQVPTASFTATPTSGRAPLAVNFTDTSRGIPTTWLWNFGDGTTSTQQNPTKTYSTPGTYSVQLTASNSLGTNTVTRSALITAQATIISPASIPSAETFDQPSFSPGITYVGLDSAPSTEVHGEPRLDMQVRPSSASSAEAFGMLTTKLVFGLEGIPSAESVSPVSFTTQFITAAGDIPSEEGFGTLLNTMFMSAFGDIAPEAAVEAPSFIQSAPPPPPPTDWSAVGKQDEKYYLYKVSKHDGTYVGVWVDVADNLEFTERINSPGTTTTVRLARSANTTREVRANLLTQGGDYLTTEDGARLVSVYETPNTVGEGTDVELNYNVDIYVHYGEFARLVTQLGTVLSTV
ncbi:PKD domain-containing protein [Dietzia maris]|uniref:PKD domain-containing protein n=1 Tax=Dietzia maris TaxID=37915 RepID=UPI0037CAFAA6